jgi:hypothetical protein
MDQLSGVVVGGVIALISGVVSAAITLYYTNRREWVFRVRDERRGAYEAFLPKLDKALAVMEDVGAHTGDSASLAKFRHAGRGDAFRSQFGATLVADVARLGRAHTELSDAIDQLGLVAGRPVHREALGVLVALTRLRRTIHEFVQEESTSVDLVQLVPLGYRDDNRRRVVDSMGRDLAQPWLRHLHDHGSRRWWRFWEKAPALGGT